MFTIALERRLRDAGELFGDLGGDGAWIGDRSELDRANGVEIGDASKQTLTREQLPEGRSEREDVAPSIERHLHDLLGRQIRELARDEVRSRSVAGRHFREAEVEQLHLAAERREDVRGVHVTMDERERSAVLIGEIVGVVKGVGRPGRRPRRDVGAEPNVPRGDRVLDGGKGLAEHQLHRDVVLLGVAAHLEGADDVRMGQARDQLPLLEEHLEHALVHPHVMASDLQRDDLIAVPRLDAAPEVDGAHAAAGDLRDHLPLP